MDDTLVSALALVLAKAFAFTLMPSMQGENFSQQYFLLTASCGTGKDIKNSSTC